MTEEKLLEAWIAMTMLVRGNRVLRVLTYSEMVALRILKTQDGVTAEDLRGLMHLYKSQMTGVMTSLEKKQLIERKTDPSDKRKMLIFLKEDGTYNKEHEGIRQIMEDLVAELGEERARLLTELLMEAEEILSRREKSW